MKYRSRTEIVAMILEAANGGATKTRIMYKGFLSYAQLREYVSVLIENNLLEYLEGSQNYKTTEKRIEFPENAQRNWRIIANLSKRTKNIKNLLLSFLLSFFYYLYSNV